MKSHYHGYLHGRCRRPAFCFDAVCQTLVHQSEHVYPQRERICRPVDAPSEAAWVLTRGTAGHCVQRQETAFLGAARYLRSAQRPAADHLTPTERGGSSSLWAYQPRARFASNQGAPLPACRVTGLSRRPPMMHCHLTRPRAPVALRVGLGLSRLGRSISAHRRQHHLSQPHPRACRCLALPLCCEPHHLDLLLLPPART